MYSGSLATSQHRGFLIRSHLGSVAFRLTDGSRWAGRPRYSRNPRPAQPETVSTSSPASTNQRTREKVVMAPHSISEPLSLRPFRGWLVGGNRLPREPLTSHPRKGRRDRGSDMLCGAMTTLRSEEHTSELQS